VNEEISFERGDLVRWYENYHDIATTKDTGLGVILEKHEYSFKDADLSYTNYKVYRNKHADVMHFDIKDLIKVKQEK